MKTITKTIATIILTLTLFAFPTFADCGEMPNGNRCLVQDRTDPKVIKTEKDSFEIDKEIAAFVREILGKIFGYLNS